MQLFITLKYAIKSFKSKTTKESLIELNNYNM